MSHRTDRRHRKKIRERQDDPQPLSPPLAYCNGRHGDVSLFKDPVATAADLRLVRRAVNQDWEIPPEMQEWLFDETMKVVRQTDGVSENESDKNSIAACVVAYDMYQAGVRADGLRAPPLDTRLPRIRRIKRKSKT